MRRLEPEPAEVHDVAAFVAAAPRPSPADRPWVLVNMIASLDGSITVDDRSGGLARPADREMFFALRGIADVVLAGAGTVRTEGYGPARPSASVRSARRGRGQTEVPAIAVLTRRLELDLEAPLFTAAEERPIILTCEAAPAERRSAAAAVAEVIVAGEASVDLPAALRSLHERGVRAITCEGGPQVNGDLLLADLVDEWCLTLSPLLVGGDAARAIVGPLPPAPRDLHLDWVLEGDGLLLTRWLRVR
jgi:riboflavin-specific deaminase-like protein